MAGPHYTTNERVKAVHRTDSNVQEGNFFRTIAASSRKVENLTDRKFIPYKATKYFPWPPYWTSSSFRLWLDDDLLEVTEILLTAQESTPIVLPANSYFLEQYNRPPYRYLELDIRDSYYFGGGQTWQRTVSINGLWGYQNTTEAAGSLTAAITSTTSTGISISDSSLIGIGDTILIDSEQMFVIAKGLSNTGLITMECLTADIDNDNFLISGSNISPGEIIQIESEKMYVRSIADNRITVTRAHESALASHDDGIAIYLPKGATVVRGANGTTAATHLNSASIRRYYPPEDVEELCIAETIAALMEQEGGYSRWVGSDHAQRQYAGRSLDGLRKEVESAYYVRKIVAI